jgi:hypothetical protein
MPCASAPLREILWVRELLRHAQREGSVADHGEQPPEQAVVLSLSKGRRAKVGGRLGWGDCPF